MFLAVRRSSLILVLCLVAGPLLAQDRSAAELKRLQGAWTVQGGEHDGKPLDGVKGGVLTIIDRNFSLHTASGKDLKGQLKIDASGMPVKLDFVHADGAVWEAIYTVDGDDFKLNYIEAGGKDKRPTGFTTGNGTEASIVVMKKSAAR